MAKGQAPSHKLHKRNTTIVGNKGINKAAD